MADDLLCPKCGAYWACSCLIEDLVFIPDVDCEHDWAEIVGVELDEEIGNEASQVYGCRLCGRFAADNVARTIWRL